MRDRLGSSSQVRCAIALSVYLETIPDRQKKWRLCESRQGTNVGRKQQVTFRLQFKSWQTNHGSPAYGSYRNRSVVPESCFITVRTSIHGTTSSKHIRTMQSVPHISLLLALAGTDNQPDNEEEAELWCSWTPRFHRLTKRAQRKAEEYALGLGEPFVSGVRQYREMAHARKPEYRLDPLRPQEIALKGAQLATVSHILDTSACPKDGLAHWNHFRLEWVARCTKFIWRHMANRLSLQQCKELLHRHNFGTTFEMTSCHHGVQHRHTEASEKMYAQNLRQLHDFDDGLRQQLSLGADDEVHDPVIDYLACQNESANSWRRSSVDRELLLASLSGCSGQHFGWIPHTARPGDTVCCFLGCPRPFVLRKRCDGQFRLLGDSWMLNVKEDHASYLPETELRRFTLA